MFGSLLPEGDYLPSLLGVEPRLVSTLDRCRPAMSDGADEYEHWGLTHFPLDGHHKLEAAASAGRAVQLLSLLAVGDGLTGPEDHGRPAALHAQPRLGRGVRLTR